MVVCPESMREPTFQPVCLIGKLWKGKRTSIPVWIGSGVHLDQDLKSWYRIQFCSRELNIGDAKADFYTSYEKVDRLNFDASCDLSRSSPAFDSRKRTCIV